MYLCPCLNKRGFFVIGVWWKRLYTLDLKSNAFRLAGSNPATPTNSKVVEMAIHACLRNKFRED